MNELITTIAPLLNYKKYILIGENHGVNENTTFIEHFVKEISENTKIDYIAFEYPAFCIDNYISAVANDSYKEIEELPVTKMLLNDGRFSKNHFELLKYLFSKRIKFIFFDSGLGSWDERDKSMFDNLRKIKHTDKSVVVIVAGNIHTNLSQLIIDNKQYNPLGTYFNKNEVLLIKLQYHSGEFFNFERRSFKTTLMPDRSISIVDKNQIIYHLDKATPTK